MDADEEYSTESNQTASPTSHSLVSSAENAAINDREFTSFSRDKEEIDLGLLIDRGCVWFSGPLN